MVENDDQREGEQTPKPDVPDVLDTPECESVNKVEVTANKRNIPNFLIGWLIKNWHTLLPVTLSTIFSLIAVGFSISSCVISKQANQLAQRAIDIGTVQFFQENKPYIILKPIKYAKLESYYKYEPLPEKNVVVMEIQFQIRNIGKAAAKELAVFRELKLGQPSIPKQLDLPLPTTLGPEQEYFISIKTMLGWDNKESYEKYVKKLSSEKGPEVTIRMGVTYLSELNPEQSFSSAIVTKLTKQRAQIVKMEYEDEGHLIDVESN